MNDTILGNAYFYLFLLFNNNDNSSDNQSLFWTPMFLPDPKITTANILAILSIAISMEN